jgi:hypothetical protein
MAGTNPGETKKKGKAKERPKDTQPKRPKKRARASLLLWSGFDLPKKCDTRWPCHLHFKKDLKKAKRGIMETEIFHHAKI